MSNTAVSSMWDAVIGQPHAVELLQRLTEHPVHGFLLVGPEGCGKDEAARAFATTLLTGAADPSSRFMRRRSGPRFALELIAHFFNARPTSQSVRRD